MQLLLTEGGRGVVEVQDGGGRLDDVPAAVGSAEAVVSGQTEVAVAAAGVAELKHLAGNHRLLLGHAEEEGGRCIVNQANKWKTAVSQGDDAAWDKTEQMQERTVLTVF